MVSQRGRRSLGVQSAPSPGQSSGRARHPFDAVRVGADVEGTKNLGSAGIATGVHDAREPAPSFTGDCKSAVGVAVGLRARGDGSAIRDGTSSVRHERADESHRSAPAVIVLAAGSIGSPASANAAATPPWPQRVLLSPASMTSVS